MDKELLIAIQNKNDYYRYFKENSFWIKSFSRGVIFKEFDNFIKEKYSLKVTDRVNGIIENIDLIESMLNSL